MNAPVPGAGDPMEAPMPFATKCTSGAPGAALVWSRHTPTKSTNINSTIGRIPLTAAPVARSMKATSEIAVSRTLVGPKCRAVGATDTGPDYRRHQEGPAAVTGVRFPQLSTEQPDAEGVVSTWFVNAGESVAAGQLIANVPVDRWTKRCLRLAPASSR